MTDNDTDIGAQSKTTPVSILRSASTVGGFTVLSRLLGLARDIMNAFIFGSTAVWDSFVIAFTVPNLFRRIFGEGAMTSSFLPVAVEARKRDGIERTALITSAVATSVGLLLTIVSVIISAGCVLFLLSSSADTGLTPLLLMVLIFYLPFICISIVFGAALNSVKHFGWPAFTPVLLNIVWIGGLAAVLIGGFNSTDGILIVSSVIVAGGALQAVLLIPVLYKKGVRVRFRLPVNIPEVKRIASGMLPVILALVVMQINVLVDRILAVTMIEGSGAVSALFYSNRLMQFPLAIFGIAMGVAVFPSLREYAVDRDFSAMWSTLNYGVRILIFLILPCAAGLIAAGMPIIDIIFNRGAFAESGDAFSRTYFALAAYSAGLIFFSLRILCTRTFHSLDNRRLPAFSAGVMVFVNLGLNLLFLTVTDLREAGLALSTSITAFLNVAVLFFFLAKQYDFNNIIGVFNVWWKTTAAVVIMAAGVVLVGGNRYFSLFTWGEGFPAKFLRMFVAVGTGVCLYVFVHALLRTKELKECFKIIRKKHS